MIMETLGPSTSRLAPPRGPPNMEGFPSLRRGARDETVPPILIA